MSKLHTLVLRAFLIAAFSTTAAQAQTVLSAQPQSKLGIWQLPEASPTPTASPTPAAPMQPVVTSDRKNSVMWHNGRGPEYFLAGDYLFTPNSKNEFNAYGNNSNNTFAGRAAVEYPIGKIAVMAEGTYDHYQYTHTAGPVTVIGGNGSTVVPTFYAHNIDWDGRIGVGLQYPRVFLVASYAQRTNNYGYPNLQGLGFGVEKLPDFNEKSASMFGSFLWYPQFGGGATLSYGFYKYQVGAEVHVPSRHIPLFVEVGYMGDFAYSRINAPANVSDNGLFAGLGVHF